MNLSFHVGADALARASITEAQKCERAALREILKPGSAYVGDRYYGIDYGFFGELETLLAKQLLAEQRHWEKKPREPFWKNL